MISEEVLRDLKKDTDALKERILKKQNKTIRMISELDNILMFNSEIAIDLLEKKESPEENEKALDMIIEAMHRAITQLKETEKNDRELIREILTGIRKLMIVNGNSLTSFLDPTTVTRIRNRIAKALVRERYRKVLNTFLSLTTGVVKLIWKNVSKLLLLLIGRYKRIKELTGIEATPEDVTEHIAHLLKESEALFSKLPYIFQKLYENKPVVDNRLFVMRKKEIGELSKQYQNFKNGHPSKVMIFGETGSGKTSLLYFTQNMLLRNEKVINITFEHTIPDKNKLIGILAAGFNLPDCRTLDDLKRQLNLLPGPVYLICENLHNLYLKKMGGFEILQEFLLLMNHTQKKVFWIVSCNKYSWEYLQIVAGVKLHFTKVIDLGNLNAEEIENVIVKRQRISGYQVIYTPAPEDLVSKTYKKCKTPQAKQNYLHDRFYKRLAFASGGNLMVAMQLSLKAIEKVEKDYLIVNVAVKVDSNFLTTLSEESLFYLTALLQHGELCVEEYSIIFNTTIEQASLVVNSLTDKGILNENEGNYKIHPYLLRPIVQVLLNKNLLV
jgi:predicted ABC-type ATPase